MKAREMFLVFYNNYSLIAVEIKIYKSNPLLRAADGLMQF